VLCVIIRRQATTFFDYPQIARCDYLLLDRPLLPSGKVPLIVGIAQHEGRGYM
jgi:hypothetical protein